MSMFMYIYGEQWVNYLNYAKMKISLTSYFIKYFLPKLRENILNIID